MTQFNKPSLSQKNNMYKFLLIAFLYLGLSSSSAAQVNIDINVDNYPGDTMILGYYLADKLLVQDTLFQQDSIGHFVYQRDSLLSPGLYILVSVPQGLFYQFIMEPDDQVFKLRADAGRENSISFEGSEDNELFTDYMLFLADSRMGIQNIDNALQTSDSSMVSIIDQLQQDKQMINDQVADVQRQIVENYPNTITALLIRANLPFEFAEFEGTEEEIDQQRYLYYKMHYFDNVDLAHPAILRTPIIHDRVNFYLENLTPREPDSITVSVDYLLGKMEAQEETFRYYLSYLISQYANSKYIGMETVYVHLALNYYGKGKASWVTKENLDEIVDNAKKLEPVLIGKDAPDFVIQKEDGSPISLADLNTDYSVIVFWRPECGFCAKAMPFVVEFQEKWKEKVQVLTICTRTGKEYDSCWEDVKAKNMESLINAGDQYNRSRVMSLYNAVNTPLIYILDKDHKIKLRKVPAENLNAIMEELIKIDGPQE